MPVQSETEKAASFIQTIETFLLQEPDLAVGRSEIGVDESLIEGGLIDSMGILKLIAFVEESFDIILSEDDITGENFASIRSIVSLVLSYTKA